MSTLSPENWKQVSPYLDEALALPESERSAWLDSLRASKPELADVLQKLLQEHGAASQENFLERPRAAVEDDSALHGRTIGPYTLISTVGRGGMGSVWLAERSDGRFERRVAVKFLHFGLAAQGGAERFKREGRILGQLAHPHIAELIDAGVTPDGEPYLVLEYVEGDHIDRYCDEHQLDLEARIRLFLDVLSAVAQAHANLIVHRDIKPSNVLVSKDGQVKLLDFGVAKLLEDDGSSAPPTRLTLEGAGALTPLYAAPEQVSAGTITTATDVYALGVLLYMILTGRHPAGPGPHSPADLVKAIAETEPPRASDAAVPGDGRTVAELRASTPEKLRRQLRGDLDTILAKALKKAAAERYGSVAALAEDLQRYLRHEPVSARPDTLVYRARKYARRHRAGLAVAVGFMLVVVGFAVLQAFQLRRITRERDHANRITQFMTNMFRVSDPGQARGNKITVREVLDKASKNIDAGLAKDPEVQAQMMHVMGDVYEGLGLFPDAESLLRRAIEIRSRVLGSNHPDTLQSRSDLGAVLQQEGRYAEAESLQRETLEAQRRLLGLNHPDTVMSIVNLGGTLVLEGRYQEAEKFHREALDLARRILGPDDPTTLSAMHNLGSDLYSEGRYAEAEKLDRETLEICRRSFGSDHPATLASMTNLGVVLMDEGRNSEAESLARETLDTQRRVLGAEHLLTLQTMSSLGLILKREGRYADAEKLIRDTLEIDRRVLGPDHSETTQCIYNLACIAALKGNRDEALSLIREAVDHGFTATFDVGVIEKDPDFNSLHGDPRFAALIAYAKERAGAPAPK